MAIDPVSQWLNLTGAFVAGVGFSGAWRLIRQWRHERRLCREHAIMLRRLEQERQQSTEIVIPAKCITNGLIAHAFKPRNTGGGGGLR